MSSGYLTSDHLNFLQRLLNEAPAGRIRDAGNTATAARLLVKRFQTGMRSETALRGILATYDERQWISMNDALARWDDEGGAVGSS